MTKDHFTQLINAMNKAISLLSNSSDKDMIKKLMATKLYLEINRSLCSEEDEQDVEFDFSDLS